MPRVRLAKPPIRGPGASGSMSMVGPLYRFSCRSSRTEACWAHGLRRSVECTRIVTKTRMPSARS